MTTEPRWEEARELFLDLADLPEDEREGELDRVAARDPGLAARVRSLLRHDRGRPGGGAPAAPRRFGPYEAVRPIGRGGMGEVFVARRADGEYEREVAVKLLGRGRGDRALVRRFLRERQTLARLDHEYVARLLDGGTTEEGEPYLVMEYVEGEPADVFAARLELRERLELFLRIGRAVAHAHGRGFVHRDLKPQNVLVRADGTPRLLDFGIARPEEPDEIPGGGSVTRTGQRLFTPEYASPEQVRGEPATVRSDVFALGVLLPVFLCGESPWKAGDDLRALELEICAADPDPPSRRLRGTGRARLAGDLDAIVLQCLAQRPERRYASVAELCEDVRRHLDGRPIRARRTGAFGRAARFARRRPAHVLGVSLVVLAFLAGGLAWRSERRAERRREELAAAVEDRIAAARARWSDGEEEAAVQELDAALAAVGELPDDAELELRIPGPEGRLRNMQEQWSAGRALVERAEALLGELDDVDPRIRATLLNTRVFALQKTEPGERSRGAARAALDHALDRLPSGETLRVDALLGWADELRRAGDAEEALRTLSQAVAEVEGRDPRSELLSRLLNEEAVALAGLGRLDEAARSYRRALEILGWHRGERHPSFAALRFNLGTTLFRLDRLDEAEAEHRRSLAASRPLGDEFLVAANQHFLGHIHYARGELEEGETAAREAVAIRERLGQELHTVRSRCLLGLVLARSARPEEARAALEPLLADLPPDVLLADMEADARRALGAILQDAGEDAAARPHLLRALQLERERLGPSHPVCRELEERLARGR